MVAFTASAALLHVLFLASIVAASPMPLNINLGAYSPAIVVGDGAIEFDSASGAKNSVANALLSSGTTVDTAAPVVTTISASEDSAGVAVIQANADDSSILSEPASFPAPGSKELDPRV